MQVLCNDPAPLCFHGEPILRDGVVVGDLRSASFGHTLQGAVGLSMVKRREGDKGLPVNKEWLTSGKWQIDVAGKLYPASVSLQPMFDPQNKKIKA